MTRPENNTPNVSGMTTDEAIAALKRQYHKEWRQRNPEKVKASNDRYWQKKVNKLMAEQTTGNKQV